MSAFFTKPRVVFGLFVLALTIVFAVVGPMISVHSFADMDIANRLAAPSNEHWLGCDQLGRDVLLMLAAGARVSLYVSVVTVFASVGLGTVVGIVSGFYSGITDRVLMRAVDIVMALPGILVAMVLAAFLGAGINNVVIAIAATGWTSSARLIRAQALSLRERDYVQAARALGASDLRLMIKHILPMTVTPLIVHSTFSLSSVILVESSLSFLGLGVQDDAATWGALLSQGRSFLDEAPWLSLAPGFCIMLLVMGLNFLGDGLRDHLDPKSS